MHGKTELFQGAVIAISLLAAGSDLVRGKIYNLLTIPALIAGVVFSFWVGGWEAGLNSGLGIAAGLLLYGWMFWIGVMGGGDVKLLMALGAWGGIGYVVETGLVAVFLGGLLGAITLVFKGRMKSFIEKIRMTLMSVVVKQLEYIPPKIDYKLTMPYGVPIAIAAIWSAFADPLAQLGLKLW